MARKPTELKREYKKRLVDLIYQNFGKPVTHSFQCEHLSRDIEQATGTAISPNTLRRLLGFIETEFSPSIRTLNALAVYTGYADWHTLLGQTEASVYQPMTLDHETKLYLEFYQIETKTEADMNFHNVARNIAFRILFNPALLHKLAPFLAKHPVAQVYFFERFPYIDALATDYKRSIQLYLQKKTDEAQVFGNSLLFLGSFLSGNRKEEKLYIDRINQYKLTSKLHPFIVARYIGSNILFAIRKNQPFDHWLQEAERWDKHFTAKAELGIWYYPFFHHLMGDYLNLAGLYEYSNRIMRSIRHQPKPYEIERGYEEGLESIYQVASHRVSPERFQSWINTTDVFTTMNPLFRKYLELQALTAYYSLLNTGRKKQKALEHIRLLVEQTKYYYFLERCS